MGQKVNPIGLRLGINRNWESRWFPSFNGAPQNIAEDHKIRKFLKKEEVNIRQSIGEAVPTEIFHQIALNIKDTLTGVFISYVLYYLTFHFPIIDS